MAKGEGYYIMARLMQEITAKYYEPGNHAKCYKQVWRKHIYPLYGTGYRAYLRYIKVKSEEQQGNKQLKIEFEI